MAASRWLHAALVTAALLVPARAARAADHPSLLFGPDDIPALRARLAGPLKPVGDAIAAGVEFPFDGGDFPETPDLGYQYFDDRRALADTLAVYAFAAVAFDPSSQVAEHARQMAKAYLLGVCQFDSWVFPETQDGPNPDLNLGHFLMDVSLAYDWLYDDLSDAERQEVRDKVVVEGQKMYVAATPPATDQSGWWLDEYLQNHHWINNAGLGMAALAFSGEIGADTGAWLDTTRTALAKAHSVLDLIHGGAWHEGIGYLNYGMDALVPFSMANVRAGGADYADTSILRDYPRLRMYAMPPASAHSREYPVWGDFSGYQDDNTLGFVWHVAHTRQDGLARWYAEQYLQGHTQGNDGLTSWPPSQRGFILAAIDYDDGVASTPPPARGAAWALDDDASDLSIELARSGWDDGGTLLAFKTGVFGGHANFGRLENGGAPGGSLDFGHDHDDDMSLYLFGEGEWLTTPVPAYFIGRDNGSPEGNRTKYANSLLVDGTGQLGEGVRTCDMASCTWFFDRRSSIPIKGSTADDAYFLGAGSALYDPALGLKSFGRSVLFVDRRFPVVRDVVVANAPHRFDVVYHAIDDVTEDGAWLRLEAKNGKNVGVRVVAPADFAVDTEAQTTDHLDGFDPDGQMTAAYIHSATDRQQQTFLTALVPSTDATWNARPSVEPVDASAPDRGVVIDDGAGATYTAVFADDPASTAEGGGVAVTGMAGAVKKQDGKLAHVVLAGGSKLVVDGTTFIDVLAGAPATLEVVPRAGGVDVSGDPVEARVHAPAATHVTVNGAAVPFAQEGDFVHLYAAPSAPPDTSSNPTPGAGGSSTMTSNDVPHGSTSPDSAGCACSSTGHGGSGWPAALLLLMGGIAGAARKRRGAASALAALGVVGFTGAAHAQTLSFGVVSPDLKVRPADTPATAGSATLRAAKNEFEAFQLVFTSSGGTTSGVGVKLSKSLTGPGGATIPDDHVVLYAERYYNVGTPSNSEGAAGRWPDPLVPDVDTYFHEKRNAFPFDVPAGESRAVWVDILVPDDAAPGDYAGELEVDAGGAAQGSVPIALHVGTFSLPSTASLASAFGMGWAEPCVAHTGNVNCAASWDEDAANKLRVLYLRAGLDHRFTISDTDYQPPFGGSQAPYEQYVMPLVDGTGPTRLPGAKLTAIRLDGGASTLSQWIAYAKAKNFFDRMIYYPVDEPGSNSGMWSTFVSDAQTLHAADPAARILITSSIDEADAAGATDNVDLFVPVINYMDDKTGQYAGNERSKYDTWQTARSNRAVWAYQSCMSHGCGSCGDATTDSYFTGWPQRVIDSSAVQDRAFPWIAFELDITGELYFETTYQLSTAWDDNGQCAFSGSGDGTIFYPGKPSVIGGTTDIPVESIRMKLIREGMEDYEYLVQANAIDPAKAHQIASTLFPQAWDTAKSPSDLEQARDQLFDLLDQPASSGTGGAGGGAGTTGSGGGAGTTGSGGAGGGSGGSFPSGGAGGATASGGSAGAGATSAGATPSGSSSDGSCGCRAAGSNDAPGDAPLALLALGVAFATSRASRRNRCGSSRPGTRPSR